MRTLEGMPRAVSRLLTVGLLWGLVACSGAPGPVPAAEPLAIPINLLCTTCNDFLRCEPDAAAGPAGRLVYRIEEKSFWGQVATIGDYLLQLFRPKTSDERSASIYRMTGSERRIERGLSVRIDAVAHRIEFPGARIDQRNGDWYDAAGAKLGRCAAMTRRDGFAMVREFLGRPAAPGSAP
jgi:hypothetical protein